MKRNEALDLLHTHMQNINLRRHCYAVEAVMRSLANRLGGDEETWGIAGLLHDADYELLKDDKEKSRKEHTKQTIKWLEDTDASTDIKDAASSHAWKYVEGAPEPQTNMQWALYTCDELTGLIVAVALVKPEKKLASVTVDSVLNKWDSKSFAAGVDRKQIEMCEERLGIPLREFVGIALTAMQVVHLELGL
jgi:uncharacterized protein